MFSWHKYIHVNILMQQKRLISLFRQNFVLHPSAIGVNRRKYGVSATGQGRVRRYRLYSQMLGADCIVLNFDTIVKADWTITEYHLFNSRVINCHG
jgi:hypothetical protein